MQHVADLPQVVTLTHTISLMDVIYVDVLRGLLLDYVRFIHYGSRHVGHGVPHSNKQ